ncbi:Uncharacterized protein FKW44_012707 [Caligus rogercresseyi]|uniref:C2H2-type domain-containing protein n=1 Tax=Caligus rogercresseyi TaxID=217165 RepID=A0A7T8K9R0_CALRO|nr:Uncharacterized protein FKW44_012707 [Caligus rogercresseyi]
MHFNQIPVLSNAVSHVSFLSSASTASIMSQHGNKRLFKCGFCSSTFADTYKLERHVKSEHRDITDRAKYETFPWQEPGGSGNTSSSKSSSSHRSRIHAPRTLLVDPSQTTFSSNMGHKTISHHQHHPHHIAATTALQPLPPPPQQQPLSASNGLKLKMEPAGLDLDASLVSSEYFLCQVCSKIFVSYKDFSLHMNESPACKNVGGEVLCGEEEEDHGGFSSNDVLVILSPEDSLKFAGEAILESVVEAAASAGPNEIMTQQAVYECQLCRALFASADYLKKHLELCQTSAPKRRKT